MSLILNKTEQKVLHPQRCSSTETRRYAPLFQRKFVFITKYWNNKKDVTNANKQPDFVHDLHHCSGVAMKGERLNKKFCVKYVVNGVNYAIWAKSAEEQKEWAGAIFACIPKQAPEEHYDDYYEEANSNSNSNQKISVTLGNPGAQNGQSTPEQIKYQQEMAIYQQKMVIYQQQMQAYMLAQKQQQMQQQMHKQNMLQQQMLQQQMKQQQMGSPITSNQMMGSPMMGSPMMGSHVMGSPVMGSALGVNPPFNPESNQAPLLSNSPQLSPYQQMYLNMKTQVNSPLLDSPLHSPLSSPRAKNSEHDEPPPPYDG